MKSVEKGVYGIEIRYYCEKSINLLNFFINYVGKITDMMTKFLNLCFYINWMYSEDILWLIKRLNKSWQGVTTFLCLIFDEL